MLSPDASLRSTFPLPLSSYPPAAPDGLLGTLAERVHIEPFNLVATGIFLLAILHTFLAARFMELAHDIEARHEARQRERRQPFVPSLRAEALHFLGEIEVVFGLWVLVLLVAMLLFFGWETATHYLNDGVNYTEPLLVVGPLLGSFITEPAAMTISALLLARQFYDLLPSKNLKYATLGLLFVNVSIGGTLTHFAAPPVLMVARPWNWDTTFMATHIGWRAEAAMILATGAYFA